MQITLTRSGDYAVRSVLAVARRGPNRLTKAREIAEEMDIPGRYVAQILATLVRTDILEATAGPSGGYRLAVPPEEVTLLRVVLAVEGPLGRACCVLSGGPCDWEAVCPLHPTWKAIEQGVAAHLAATTFERFCQD